MTPEHSSATDTDKEREERIHAAYQYVLNLTKKENAPDGAREKRKTVRVFVTASCTTGKGTVLNVETMQPHVHAKLVDHLPISEP